VKLADKLVAALNREMERVPRGDRNYLGGSSLGDPCHRRLWYDFHHFHKEPPSARVRRIFDLGNAVEDLNVARLKTIPGVQLLSRDPKTGKQFELSKFGGHVKSHFDGLIRAPHLLDSDEWHLLEIKSMKTDGSMGFTLTRKQGLYKTHPKYWAQCQWYMHDSQGTERPIRRALHLSENKNDSELHAEIIEYDPFLGLMFDQLAKKVVEATEPLEKISQDPALFICRFCDHRGHCWEGKPVPVTDCRQCKWAVAESDRAGPGACWLCTNPDSPHYNTPAGNPCPAFEGYEGHTYTMETKDAGGQPSQDHATAARGSEAPAADGSTANRGLQTWP
jgi:hypothetical protein